MSWSYSGNPDSSALDKVRFLIQDTDTSDQQFSDQEINAMIAGSSSVYVAAIACVRSLIAKYTRRADKNVGDLHISFSQIAKGYQALIASLSQQAVVSGTACPAYAGGISRSDKQIDELNTDRVKPSFRKGQMDFRGQFNSQNDAENENEVT